MYEEEWSICWTTRGLNVDFYPYCFSSVEPLVFCRTECDFRFGTSSPQFDGVYNVGLVASGLLFVFFLIRVYWDQETRLGRFGLWLFGLTGIAVLFIGFTSNIVALPGSVALVFALTGGSGVLLLGVTLM